MENCCSNEMNHCYCNHMKAKRTSIKHIWMFWLVFISLISGTLCDGGTEIQGVQASGNMFNEITMENFDQITKDKDIMLILFYMPWCGHCKALQPEWEKASKVLEDNREYVLGRSNCDGSGKPLCQKVNVEMYPDIRLYRHGKYIESYEGDRKAESILEFVQRAQSTTGRVGSSPPPADLSTTPQPAAQQFAPPEQSATIPQTQNTATFQQQQSQGGQTNTLPQVQQQQQQQQQLQMSFAPPQQQLTFPTMQQVPAMQQFQTPIQTPNGLGTQLDLFTTVPNSDVMGRAGGIEPQQQPFIANGNSNNNGLFWSSVFQNRLQQQQNPSLQTYLSSPFYNQQQTMYNPYLAAYMQQQQRQRQLEQQKTLMNFLKNNQKVRGPSVWGQGAIPGINSAGNFEARLGQNPLWRQYFQKLQMSNSQNDWIRRMYMPALSLMKYVVDRQHDIVRQPAYQRLLNPTEPGRIRQYYEWKYPGFDKLNEAEKQRRVEMGSYLLTPLKNLRQNMGVADLRHLIHANKSFDGLYKHFKKTPSVLNDISNTISKSNFEHYPDSTSPIKSFTSKSGHVVAPHLDNLGNLHLEAPSPPQPPKKKDKGGKPKHHKQEVNIAQRLNNLGNLHLDRAKKIFYTNAHPVPISRARAQQIALLRARLTASNRRMNPLVLNKMLHNSAFPYTTGMSTAPYKPLTGLPMMREKPNSVQNAASLIIKGAQTNSNSMHVSLPMIRVSSPTLNSIKKVNTLRYNMNSMSKPSSPIMPKLTAQELTGVPLIRTKSPIKLNPLMEKTGVPLLRMPSKSSKEVLKSTRNNPLFTNTGSTQSRPPPTTTKNAASAQLDQNMNKILPSSTLQQNPHPTNLLQSVASLNDEILKLRQEKAGLEATNIAHFHKDAHQSDVLNLAQLHHLPNILHMPTNAVKVLEEDDPSLDYPKPKITKTSKKAGESKSKIAITASPPLQYIEPEHGNTALKIASMREEKNKNEQLTSFINTQHPNAKLSHLLENALGNIKMNLGVKELVNPAKLHEISLPEPKVKSMPTVAAMSAAEKRKNAYQLSLVEDFLRTKIADVNNRPSFKHDDRVITEAINKKPVKAEMVMSQTINSPVDKDLSNFFKLDELESHEIEKVDKPVYKKRSKSKEPNHTHTEFLLKTISPDPLPWDKRAKVTFKLSKKSDIPGKPQRVLGVYGSLRKKKKKRKKKRFSEQDIDFDSDNTKHHKSKQHKSKHLIKSKGKTKRSERSAG